MSTRIRYRIDFGDGHYWFLMNKDKIDDSIKELKQYCPQLYEVTEQLDEKGEIIHHFDKKLNIEKES
jgi:hypothetical protein